MRIDSHQHFWRYRLPEGEWLSEFPDLQRDFLAIDLKQVSPFDGCVAVQADQSLAENDLLLDQAQDVMVKGVVGWLDLASEDLPTQIRVYANRAKFVGVRHIVQAESPGFLARPEFRRGVQSASDSGLTYDLLIYSHQMEEALDFVRALPGVSMVLDHCAKPKIAQGEWEPWASRLRQLAACENLSCKLSGLAFEADRARWNREILRPYYRHALECFGAERCMFGSDWPVCLAAGSLERMNEAVEFALEGLTSEEQALIFGGTAQTFYGLDP